MVYLYYKAFPLHALFCGAAKEGRVEVGPWPVGPWPARLLAAGCADPNKIKFECCSEVRDDPGEGTGGGTKNRAEAPEDEMNQNENL